MPTYEFECDGCGHNFEQLLSVRSRNLKVCPECRGKKLRRIVSTFSPIFKGEGWTKRFHRGDKK